MSTTDDTVYDAVYGDDEAAYAAAVIDPTRADVVRYYGTGTTSALVAGRRLEAVLLAGKAAGLLTTGPEYSRAFRGYVTDAHHAVTKGDGAGGDYWTAHAAYVLARATGDDWRPSDTERR